MEFFGNGCAILPIKHNDSGMNSCRTGYYSASYFGFLNFSSIFKSLMLLGNYLCRHVVCSFIIYFNVILYYFCLPSWYYTCYSRK